MNKIIFHLRTLWLAISFPFRRNYQTNVCNHTTKRTRIVKSFGIHYILSVELTANGRPDYCPDCINKMTIRCAWCGKPIYIDDPVTLYRQPTSYSVPAHAVRYQDDLNHLVGCLRLECCISYAGRQGFWRVPGIVDRVPSPIKMCVSSGKMIIVQDISNP